MLVVRCWSLVCQRFDTEMPCCLETEQAKTPTCRDACNTSKPLPKLEPTPRQILVASLISRRRTCMPMYRLLRYAFVFAALVAPLLGASSHGVARPRVQFAPHSFAPGDIPQPPAEPLR